MTSDWNSWTFAPMKPVLPYLAGFLSPLPKLIFMRAPHGKDGSSLEHGKVYQEALGESKYFHGEKLGPLDLSLFGTFACFLYLGSPQANQVLDECRLRKWYERCDAEVKAKRPMMDPAE